MPPGVLPLFPLQQVALFPSIRCPLHVFEPRYRQMTADALAGERRIGMIAVRPDHVAEMAGDPPVFAVGCEGLIVESTPLPDGRYKIVLLGTRRFRIVEEISRPSGRLYRSARVEPIEDRIDPAEANRLAALRSRTIELLSELVSRSAPRARIASDLFAGSDDGALVNALCQALDLLPAEKQALLEEDGIAARYVRLASLLEFRLAERGAGLQPSSRSVH